MQTGGYIPKSGLYVLHAGEPIYNPKCTITRNITITITKDEQLEKKIASAIKKAMKRY